MTVFVVPTTCFVCVKKRKVEMVWFPDRKTMNGNSAWLCIPCRSEAVKLIEHFLGKDLWTDKKDKKQFIANMKNYNIAAKKRKTKR